MPPNAHGTNGISIDQMIGRDPAFFILNSDGFRKIRSAKVKGRLNLPRNNTKDSGSEFDIGNTWPSTKHKKSEVYPTGSHHRNTLGLVGINRSYSTLTNKSSGNRAYKEVKSEGTWPAKAPIDKNSAETTRRRCLRSILSYTGMTN